MGKGRSLAIGRPGTVQVSLYVFRFSSLALRANISETSLVLLFNEQGEKEAGRNER